MVQRDEADIRVRMQPLLFQTPFLSVFLPPPLPRGNIKGDVRV